MGKSSNFRNSTPTVHINLFIPPFFYASFTSSQSPGLSCLSVSSLSAFSDITLAKQQ
jgi:hypothetical protein